MGLGGCHVSPERAGLSPAWRACLAVRAGDAAWGRTGADHFGHHPGDAGCRSHVPLVRRYSTHAGAGSELCPSGDRRHRVCRLPHGGAGRQPGLPAVDSGFSAHRTAEPRLSRNGEDGLGAGLRGDEHHAFLRADDRLGAWPARSHAAAEATGQLSVLAQVLAPFAGERTQEIACRLIQRFGSLRGIHAASAASLAETIGETTPGFRLLTAAIAAARELSVLAAREAVVGEPTEPNSPRLRQYLVRRLGFCREECVVVLYLSAEGLFIAEDFHEGVHGSTAILPLRRAVRRAFELDARRLVIAHNHPSGNPEPSAADIRATRHFIDVAGALDILVDDHFVVGGNRAVSLRDRGLI
ncbi:hypothetical protein CA833_13610 [Novosphingobium sp. KA1]|nr:hypothetical protein CA833_13610 [Novosphingobium sp. KA1]